jgi:hypothetical protein
MGNSKLPRQHLQQGNRHPRASARLGKAFAWCTLGPHPTQTQGRHTLPRGEMPSRITVTLIRHSQLCQGWHLAADAECRDSSPSAMETVDTTRHPNDLTRWLTPLCRHCHAKKALHLMPEKPMTTNAEHEPLSAQSATRSMCY